MNRSIVLSFCLIMVNLLCFFWLMIKTTKVPEMREVKPKLSNMKYILQWTLPNTLPFAHMKEGQEAFIERDCSETRCYVTHNRLFLVDESEFDAILFHVPEIHSKKINRPVKRSPHQKYVFVSTESSAYYPVCDSRYNSYFNWTWTYKLDSDERFGYIVVKNKNNTVIGPKKYMDWIKIDDMEPIKEDIKEKLSTKSKAAVWFVSNCNALSRRERFAENLNKELKSYGMFIDIFGKCGEDKCPPEKIDDCVKLIEDDYYFYLAFENSFSEDYVTEKLLLGLKHYAIPVVFGAANYSRFMPDGIYLNAGELGEKKLAEKMNAIINDQEKFYSYFKWHNHYSFHNTEDTPDTDDYCRFCEMLNDEKRFNTTTVYDNIKDWWTPPKTCSSFFLCFK